MTIKQPGTQKARVGDFVVIHVGKSHYEVRDRISGRLLNARTNLSEAVHMAGYWHNADKAGQYSRVPIAGLGHLNVVAL